MTEYPELLELVQDYLPKYLSPELQEGLFDDLRENFPKSLDADRMYTKLEDKDVLYQADGLKELPFPLLDRKSGSYGMLNLDAVILSNTCDINGENLKNKDSALHQNVVCAAIFSLEDYVYELKARSISEERIKSFISDLKSNKLSNFLFLPEIRNESEVILVDSFVQFDFSVSHEANFLLDENIFDKEYFPLGDRIFTLSNYGFYLFLLKLSIHFTRIREGVFRNK